MAVRLGAVEAEFSTDFAILKAYQGMEDADSGGFAGSRPGAVDALCGTKHANLRVRAERWDSRPPMQRGWEDVDELPFAEVPDEGPLVLSGFEASDVGLDVDGLGRARVLVQARGRHRYGYSDFREDLPREEWLLQFWPDPEAQDGLAGDPRRLAGPGPMVTPRPSGRHAALHAWRQTGWHAHLSDVPGYDQAERALNLSPAPLSYEELAAAALRCSYDWGRGDRSAESDPLNAILHPPRKKEQITHMTATIEAWDARKAQSLVDLAAAAELPEVRVMADFIQALLNIGLLLHVRQAGQELLVPNACPGLVWEVLEVDEQQRRHLRRKSAAADFETTFDDLINILAWAPERRLVTTPRRIAIRLGTTPDQVLGALDLLEVSREGTAVPQRAGGPQTRPGNAGGPDVRDQGMVITSFATY